MSLARLHFTTDFSLWFHFSESCGRSKQDFALHFLAKFLLLPELMNIAAGYNGKPSNADKWQNSILQGQKFPHDSLLTSKCKSGKDPQGDLSRRQLRHFRTPHFRRHCLHNRGALGEGFQRFNELQKICAC